MMSFNQTAQEQMRSARDMAQDAASYSQRLAAIFQSHLIKAHMEMVDGVREVLAHELERVNRIAAKSADEAAPSADQPQA